MGLTFRLHTEDDIPRLVRFWSEHGGWDTIDEASWRDRFLRAPQGAARIVIAEDEETGRIAGQIAFFPSLVRIGGRDVQALRPFAPIVASTVRGRFFGANPLKHPLVGMYRHGLKTLFDQGFGLAYSIPDPGWMPFLKLFPGLSSASFPLWSLPLPATELPSLPDGYVATDRLDVHDPRIDDLWAATSRQYGSLVVRDARTLDWKIGKGDYVVTGIERGDELVGLVASRHKGGHQWLICDLLAVDTGDALRAALVAAVHRGHGHVRQPGELPIRKAAVLATPPIQEAARQLGFTREAYTFHLAVRALDPSLPKEDVAPERWYVSAND